MRCGGLGVTEGLGRVFASIQFRVPATALLRARWVPVSALPRRQPRWPAPCWNRRKTLSW